MLGESKTLVWGFAMALHRLHTLVSVMILQLLHVLLHVKVRSGCIGLGWCETDICLEPVISYSALTPAQIYLCCNRAVSLRVLF